MSVVRWSAFSLVIGIALLLACGCGESPCSPGSDLYQVLGGGVPVCFGESYAQLTRYSSRATPDSVASFPAFIIHDGAATYLYYATGGFDLGVIRPFTKIGRACRSTPGLSISELSELAEHTRARIGGNWQVAGASRGIQMWTNGSGVAVTTRTKWSPTVCVSTSK
jgi:hypothetical protein